MIRPIRMYISRRKFIQLSSAAAMVPAFSRSQSIIPDPLCQQLASDPLRPQYHLLPAHNWMNDPNGPIFYHGRYHMFHQYNPQSAIWGNMNWAHATSPDMIHWQHDPIAISPTPGGPDQDGVFSGSAVLDNGRPTVIYTGVAPPDSPLDATLRDGRHTWRETQCLAVAQDEDLRIWKKLPQPVIATPPEGLKVTGFRDPALWREGDRWMLVLGSGTSAKGGMILLYSSPDLRHWTYLHPLVEGANSSREADNPVDTGDMWECPDFFPLGDKHVLLISTMGKVRWKVGTYANQRFTPEKEGVVDWGSYYAAKTMLDRDGNRILWGWIPETRSETDLIIAGWAGVMSLPRGISLNSHNELQTEVSSAAKQLRSRHISIAHERNAAALHQKLAAIRIENLAAELDIHLNPTADAFSLKLHSETGEPFATILCTNKPRQLRINEFTAPLSGPAGSPVHLHMFLDGSVLEIFANQTASLTARLYQVPSGPLRLSIEGAVELESIDLWRINPISQDRLTRSFCG
jgi:beta-fructofuranosidase